MVKLYYPPQALLAQGNKDFVELAGAKCILAIDENRQFIVVSDIWGELSWGEFWKEARISDQIEKITVKVDDSEAIYNAEVMRDRIIGAFQKIMDKKLIFFGVASFEGNAFERAVFDEVDLTDEDTETLTNVHKFRRLQNAFPNVKQGSWVEVNFFGETSPYFSLPNKRGLRDIASMIYTIEGNASGIVCTAQNAANFIILTENITKVRTAKRTQVDRKNLDQMFYLIKRRILTPISWFKIDLGIKGLDKLENWEEIHNDPAFQEMINRYYDYLKQIISDQKDMSYEQILAEDLGRPIDYKRMTERERQADLENLLEVINQLNILDESDHAESLLYYPPNILLANADKTGAAIGSAMALLSTDVGKNLRVCADLRKYLAWGNYYQDQDSQGTDTFDTFQGQDFFELENAEQLKNIYIQTFQKIMINNHIFFGVLELESNAFELGLFSEIDIRDKDLRRLQDVFHKKRITNFPKLQDGHINLKWFGPGNEYFSNRDCLGILDIAEKIHTNQIYRSGYGAGIVCIDTKSANFFILSNNFGTKRDATTDTGTLLQMFQQIQESDMVPLCWFKITLGLDALKMHPLWKNASQYTNLLFVLDNYRRYMENLVSHKQIESKYRIWE
jgi:hypothetical protein